MSKITSENLDVITVYRSSRGSIVVLKSILKQLVEKKEKAILITGDFNICYMTKRNNEISKELEEIGFHQLMQDATHIEGGHIDHVYWRPGNKMWTAPIIERHSPYHSDHDASLVTLTGNLLRHPCLTAPHVTGKVRVNFSSLSSLSSLVSLLSRLSEVGHLLLDLL